MTKRSLIWKIYPSYLLIVSISIIVLGWHFLHDFQRFHYERSREELRAAANMLTGHLEAGSLSFDSKEAASACDQFGQTAGYRFTIILPDGRVTGDSEKDPANMDNHADRPEIREAMSGEIGLATRFSSTLRQNMLYVAVPVTQNNHIVAVVRSALSVEKLNTEMYRMKQRLLLYMLFFAFLAVFATVFSTKKVSGLLAELSKHSAALGRGELEERLPSSDIAEIDLLSSSMNRMADQLNDRINTVISQRDEQNVLFACMVESVVAVNNERKVIRMNVAAKKMFDVESLDVTGKNISQIVRNSDLHDIIDLTFEGSGIVEGEILLNDRNIYLQAHGSILRGRSGEKIGALIVLNDVTRLRNLELMRKDFVANVSHELKTPITSIKGFTDTLIDNISVDEKDRDRFIQIISQQINRLQSIVDDLLSFSTLEHDIEKGEIERHNARIDHIIKNAVQVCAEKAAAQNIVVNVAAQNVTANVNVQLLEQAVINLLDNAIKYSESGTTIEVTVETVGADIVIKVKDHGYGIPHNQLTRIFERFYCVDKSRSRRLGGTGLGLAIVKHVAIAHHGRVEVESDMGAGSVFSIILPG